MRLTEVNQPRFRQPHPATSGPEQDNDPTGSESRALVALDPLRGRAERSASHRYAPFVAQLVATKDQHPQTRERRRADPADALAAYRAMAALKV
jgi:hypothetical protein